MRRPWSHIVVDWLGLSSFTAMSSVVGVRIVEAVSGWAHAWFWPVAIGLGYLLADFGSGVVHWAGDRYGNAKTPFFGPALIGPFRNHHSDPRDICRHGLLELLGNSGLVVLPFLLVAARVAHWPLFGATTAGILLIACVAAVATNLFHRWAHLDRIPGLIRWLQSVRLVLPPEEHERHHSGARDRAYCITTGWMNPLLEKIDFWNRMEKLIRKTTGMRPTPG